MGNEQRQQQVVDELARVDNLAAGLVSAIKHVRKAFSADELAAAGFDARRLSKLLTSANTALTATGEEEA